MLNKDQKKKIVNDLAEEFKKAKGVVFSAIKGLPTTEMQVLRTSLRAEQVKHKVVKLSLLKRAMQKAGIDTAEFNHAETLAASWSALDEVAPAKLVSIFAKTHDKLKALAGIVAGKLVDQAQVKVLASLPGKQDLRAQTVYVIATPLRGLVSVLSGNMRGLINVLNAKAKVQSGN